MGEPEARKGVKSIAAAAKKLDDMGVTRERRYTQEPEPPQELPNFLFGRLESNIRCFPRIDLSGCVLGDRKCAHSLPP
jgi:hypothetical protein